MNSVGQATFERCGHCLLLLVWEMRWQHRQAVSHVESIRSGVAGDGEGTEQFHVNRLATTTSDPPARTSAYRARLIFSWGKVKIDGSGRQGRLRPPAGARFFVTLPRHADASRVDTRGWWRPSDGGPTKRRSWHTRHCTSGGVRLCLDRSPRSAAFRGGPIQNQVWQQSFIH
jgi:hypothetical protein